MAALALTAVAFDWDEPSDSPEDDNEDAGPNDTEDGAEPGLDIVMQLSEGSGSSYAPVTGSEGDDTLSTELLLRYESATQAARDVTIDLQDSDVTWDDVAFVGVQTPTLVAQT
ncbi:hypothetical protein Salmuc_01530 [Salipiger mucosus DSM 16094]|uniref:Uncharacterized protein n=2 Tax=Salipiger mucosus TaxID=263378 RepID=S9SKH1_9RHOB|nr:hypothetical protein Salmuc_01530 [Salipiger mucosus DSM 16094]